jgi:arylsulfatase
MTPLVAVITVSAPAAAQQKPHIVIIWGDDIGQSNISVYSRGLMGYQTPNIDRIAKEGMMFTDYYGEQSCTAGRASFITGVSGLHDQGRPPRCHARATMSALEVKRA